MFFIEWELALVMHSVLLLRDAWAVHDLQLCSDCPNEIAEDKPGVIIVDKMIFRMIP